MNTREEIIHAALALDADDRAIIAHELWQSLESTREADAIASPIDPAWVEEIKRRRQAIRDGEVETLDWRETVAEIREEIRRGEPK